jgi:hypothetical protein
MGTISAVAGNETGGSATAAFLTGVATGSMSLIPGEGAVGPTTTAFFPGTGSLSLAA